jgi:hypothetical protein
MRTPVDGIAGVVQVRMIKQIQNPVVDIKARLPAASNAVTGVCRTGNGFAQH